MDTMAATATPLKRLAETPASSTIMDTTLRMRCFIVFSKIEGGCAAGSQCISAERTLILPHIHASAMPRRWRSETGDAVNPGHALLSWRETRHILPSGGPGVTGSSGERHRTRSL